jgi:hypothetical protein
MATKAVPVPELRTFEITTDLTEGEVLLRFRIRRLRRPSLSGKTLVGLASKQLFSHGIEKWAPYGEAEIRTSNIVSVIEVLDTQKPTLSVMPQKAKQ